MNIQQLALDPEAIKIIQAVLEGTITPLEGATNLSAYWFPKESMQKGELPFILQTRQDSLGQLDHTTIELSNQGKTLEARRLAELNWILARRTDNHELMVRCAASLAQMMFGDPSSIRDRLELLEFAVPEVLKWDRPALIKAAILAHLADARFTASHPRQKETIDTCQQALSLGELLDDYWHGRLNLIAGTEYNTIAESIEDLQSSIEYLETALKYYCVDKFPTEYASTLNNLGNSYRDLGEKLRDRALLQKAIDCYDKALPFRKNIHFREKTLGNKHKALKIIETLHMATTVGIPDSSAVTQDEHYRLTEVKNLMRAGDDRRFQAYRDAEQQQSYQQAAVAQYVQAMKKLGREGPAALRAELFHRLALLYIQSTEEDALWTGLCLANAAQRLSSDWSEVGQARVSYHRGMMLMDIGYPNKTQYLVPAEALIREALPFLKQSRGPGEFEQANQDLITCTSLLAACGVADFKDRAIALHAEKELIHIESENNASMNAKNMATEETKKYWIAELKKNMGKNENSSLFWRVWWGEMSVGDIIYLVNLDRHKIPMRGVGGLCFDSTPLNESLCGLVGWAEIIYTHSKEHLFGKDFDGAELTYEATDVEAILKVLLPKLASFDIISYESDTIISSIESLSDDYPLGPSRGLNLPEIKALNRIILRQGCPAPQEPYSPVNHEKEADKESASSMVTTLKAPDVENVNKDEDEAAREDLKWDVFISYAFEDKDDFVRPLVECLKTAGISVWFDEFTLTIGDSLRRSIDRGLMNSRYGVVVISPNFLKKEWPQRELDALNSLEMDGRKVILPVWHNVCFEDVKKFSSTLAARVASSSKKGIDSVVNDLLKVIRR